LLLLDNFAKLATRADIVREKFWPSNLLLPFAVSQMGIIMLVKNRNFAIPSKTLAYLAASFLQSSVFWAFAGKQALNY